MMVTKAVVAMMESRAVVPKLWGGGMSDAPADKIVAGVVGTLAVAETRRCKALTELRICIERYYHCLVVGHVEQEPFYVGELIAYIVIGVIGVIVSSLCVRGAYTDQRHYILPYLVFDFMILVVQAILAIWLIFVVIVNGATQDLLVVCFRVLWLFLWSYFFVVVLSFYKQLANAANKPGIRMVPAAHSVSPGTYIPHRSYSPAAPEPQYYSDSMTLV
ncbi:hypothetical protein HPB47_014429 [Ixodes persulcatus]|uniref:Uncharacterized protein n=1 Tax=Ixodes persulcatus TaxID=34615 RepID=A0AC60QZM2_IXOPE|nr:hypothetical protein HPB47_014429 [Ixodes persulcatus]